MERDKSVLDGTHDCDHLEPQHHHADHHRRMLDDFRRRFFVSLVITVPVLALSPLIQSAIGLRLEFPGSRYALLGLSTAVFFYGGWPFLTGLVEEIRKFKPGMMTLIALAITVAWGYSTVVVLGLSGKVFFWELVTLIDVMLLGHWIEMRSVMGASRALEELAEMMPKEAHRMSDDGSVTDVDVRELEQGNRVLVKPGEKIPVDGTIEEGASEVNEAMITGESRPAGKKAGDEVIGGSLNGNGSLTVVVGKTGEESYLSQVVKMVREAGASKSRAQGLADRAAFWLTIIALSVGAITLAAWLVAGRPFDFSLERTVTVMVITCPHALGLAIPLVIAVITSLSAKNGLLIRNRTPFENARTIDIVVFDKTGTLTKGAFGVTDIVTLGGMEEEELLKKAASVETGSEHTIAAGIVAKAKEKEIALARPEDFEALPGKGARAKIDGTVVAVGNEGLLSEMEAELPSGAKEQIESIANEGKTAVFVLEEKKLVGIIGLTDVIRDESKEAIQKLSAQGIDVAMITGDNEATARAVAGELGIEHYFSHVLPDKKSEKIKELKKKGRRVAMVGDGVNDAPALAEADLGIAIGAGTDIAAETADVVLVESDPRNVVDVIALSKITNRKMKQNIAWATGYNIFAIPLAAGVLAPWGVILPPAVGAIIMSASTVIVAVNARLITYEPRGAHDASGKESS